MGVSFKIEARDGRARAGALQTAHGPVPTPAFMPVGTRAAVKGVQPRELWETGTRMVLGNTYHLALRPGAARIEAAGGLSAFMGWPGATLTDSGGFQIMSLAHRVQVSDAGVVFRSHYDGRRVELPPEEAMDLQRRLGADVVMALDQLPPFPSSREELEAAADRTLRWARICREAPLAPHQSCFGIVQGGVDRELRARCAREIGALGFDGLAIGGLSVGEPPDQLRQIAEFTAALLPEGSPRYLMGVGSPREVLAAIAAGIDMFDCVLPTRWGRNAKVLTPTGSLRLRAAECKDDSGPVEEGCPCPACGGGLSRAYLRHCFHVGEMLGPILATLHNITYLQRLVSGARAAILEGELGEFQETILQARGESTRAGTLEER